jgi:hypothetical protein
MENLSFMSRPQLIMMSKADLIHGAYYAGHCRNTSIARWNGKTQCFVYWRTKFGNTFPEYIRHAEDEKVYDAFEPTYRLTHHTQEIPFEKKEDV